MKTLLKYFLLFAIIATIVISCIKHQNQTNPSLSNVQIEVVQKNTIHFADSIDNIKSSLNKRQSLIYSLRDSSFYVTKYDDGRNAVYIKQSTSGENGNATHSYYLKDHKLILVVITTKKFHKEFPFSSSRTFFINGTAIRHDEKKTVSAEALNSSAFITTYEGNRDWKLELNTLEDALKQQAEFDLVFEGITDYPKAKYLILSRDALNACRAPILIEKEDELIHEIIANPKRYRGRRLTVTCIVRDNNEAVYVSSKFK